MNGTRGKKGRFSLASHGAAFDRAFDERELGKDIVRLSQDLRRIRGHATRAKAMLKLGQKMVVRGDVVMEAILDEEDRRKKAAR